MYMIENNNKPSDGLSNPKSLSKFETLFGSSIGIRERKMNTSHRKVNFRLLALFRILLITTTRNVPRIIITRINQSPPSRQKIIKVIESKKYLMR